MKKVVSILLLLAMCLSLFAACGDKEPDKKPQQTEPTSDLDSAIDYLTMMYQTSSKDEPMDISSNKEVLSRVSIDGVGYPVTWTVKVTQGAADAASVSTEGGKTVIVVKPDTTDSLFTATATVSDSAGKTASVDFKFRIPGAYVGTDPSSMEEIVKMAYALEENTQLDKPATLIGKIIRIKTPYDDGYKNITVIIQVGELVEMPIECYRLKGDGADTLAIGDTITVTGTLKNYNGTVEFDAGCVLEKVEKSEEPAPEMPSDPTAIIDEAYALNDGASLAYTAVLTGVITKVNTPYNPQYANLTVTIAVAGREDKPIQCYRLKGEGAETLKIGDTITVTGYIVNYKGTVQFDQGCAVSNIVPGEGKIPVAPADPKQIVKEAYALKEGDSLPYLATLTGVITNIDTPYSSQYKNITVVMKVEGKEITCYRLAGEGADALMVKDTITVTGYLKNHYGTIEFDFGCVLDKVVKGEGNSDRPVEIPSDPKKIVDAAYALKDGEQLPYIPTLTGKISSVDEVYSDQYKNITVTIKIDGRDSKPIKCYHLKGEGVEALAVGDTITVTGKVKNYKGTIEFDAPSLDAVTSGGGKPIEVPTKPADILAAAGKLAEGEKLPYESTLTGKITKLNSGYSYSYENISVYISVEGKELLCYRLKGDKTEKLVVGDTITVTGELTNYKGNVQFGQGCQLDKVVSCGLKVPTDPAQIVSAAFALAENESLPYSCKLTGKITSIDTPYDSGYKNITVTIEVEGKAIKCYRLKGDDAADLKVGDTITVTGLIKNYKGTVEFDTGCELV